MKLKSIFKKTPVTKPEVKEAASKVKPEVPEGLLKRCNKCGKGIFTEDYKKNLYICPKCGGYLRMPAQKRIAFLTEKDSFEEWDTGLTTENPLHMIGYPDRIKSLQEKTKLDEAVITGKARIGANEVALMVMDGRFLMASMGEVVGEKIARGVERATKEKLPVIIFTCSGGARMQEGMTSLMQMAKTSAALKRHSDAGLLYITVLTDPTTGGVTASFAMLGDIILAEPKALIGFAGPRVIEQTIHKKLPKGFQRSEFLLEHGFLDLIVERENVPATLSELLALHAGRIPAADAPHVLPERHEPHTLLKKAGRKRRRSGNEAPSAYDIVQAARSVEHPTALELIELGFDGFIELHGDRYFSDDPAIVGGIAWVGDQVFTVIGTERGRSTKERVARNFGSAHPEGYRKAQRLMKEAERFGRPVLCLIDTAGAYCGIGAEERGQGEAIASNLVVMSELETPIVSIVVGEGGSGGALALAVADRVLMLDNAAYSVVSPEGCASILWKTTDRAADAAEALALTAPRLAELGIVDGTITSSGTHRELAERIIDRVTHELDELASLKPDALVEARQAKFRAM